MGGCPAVSAVIAGRARHLCGSRCYGRGRRVSSTDSQTRGERGTAPRFARNPPAGRAGPPVCEAGPPGARSRVRHAAAPPAPPAARTLRTNSRHYRASPPSSARRAGRRPPTGRRRPAPSAGRAPPASPRVSVTAIRPRTEPPRSGSSPAPASPATAAVHPSLHRIQPSTKGSCLIFHPSASTHSLPGRAAGLADLLRGADWVRTSGAAEAR